MKTGRIACYWITASLLCLGSCNKNTHTPATEAGCQDKSPLSANFSIEESFLNINTAWPYYNSDTVSVSVVRFTAEDSLAQSYEWQIGSGVYASRTVSLEFPQHFLNEHQSVPVTLTVKGDHASTCFPGDAHTKTITQTVYFTNVTLVSGTFYGSLDNKPNETFTITINPSKPCPAPNATATALSITNLVKDCEVQIGECYGGQYKIGYKQIMFTAGTCQSPGGTIKVNNNSIIIDYIVYENGYQQPPVKRRFTGIRT